MDDIKKIVKPLEESGLLILRCWWNNSKSSEQTKGGFLPISLSVLPPNLLGDILVGKTKTPGWGVITAGEGVIQAR